MKTLYIAAALILGMVWSVAIASAGNVDLSTVPKRDSLQLTIYNSEDLTLVRETRTVTFKKGVNPLEFSWANTLIDPSSVELKFLTHADKLDVLDTTFPHDKPQKLYWNVSSDIDGEVTIQITYFTSGITWAADYLCLADKDEQQLGLEGFVRVTNNSGEDYEAAQVRLVVGNINLVEKIAQLAQVPMDKVKNLPEATMLGIRREVAQNAMSKGALSDMSAVAGIGGNFDGKQKEIIKEGLSEYFIYTIEGTETIPNGWSKRMRSFEGKTVPFKIQYRYRPQEYGDQLVRMVLLTNDKDSKLGATPLPDGTVRVFRDNGRDGLTYLTQQHIKYVPIGDKIELNLGPDPEVIFELLKPHFARDNIWVQLNGHNEYRQIGGAEAVKVDNTSVAGWDDHSIYDQRIRNFSGKPIDVEIRRTYPGHIVFRSSLEPTLYDFQTVQFQKQVAPSEKADLLFELVQHQGYNAKQQNVTLEQAEIKP
ncbi:MAG TPA: hypothetical protein VMJ32_06450 [Pirellulales bacterium]|nr:hypothetical protein [Pirellulales bacterium]